ncbi:BcsR/BcsP family cellulose biosynthesis protein [Pusillimonas sp. ANT_WB101]|uniref:BcsR/BcsP family cellulose biosynthesis protein n=1 Tax=Pusillimonas sp. ANT_WB101 TaxID=2597356 RepID=UPI0011EBD8BC|nr:BcsR/BcsP family cellulose biosynthesis protein [Pusillimonas sp. ANT_WB101]KAA0892604.1 hypothetical protein FQ179_09835 [Pusillimonas sp. ANT_WB101]
MKNPNDITNLFAFFDEKSADQYREISGANEQLEARKRWPLFKQPSLGITPPPRVSQPFANQAPPKQCEPQANKPVRATAAKLTEPPATCSSPDVRGDAVAATELRTVFARLERTNETVVSLPMPPDEPMPKPASSMQSLFSRLRKA